MKIQQILESGKVVVFADTREACSNVTRHLKKFNIDVREKRLDVGDYVISYRVCIERKTIQDFLQSVTDQRIFRQLENLSDSYEKPVLLMEGNPELLFMERYIHENAIRGALSSIAIDYSIPIIWTYNSRESAAQIYWMAYREQFGEKRGVQIRSNKKPDSLSRQQEFIVAGLPFVSSTLSKRLLKRFGSVRGVFTAKQEKIMKVDKIGEKKARRIWEVINARYKENVDLERDSPEI